MNPAAADTHRDRAAIAALRAEAAAAIASAGRLNAIANAMERAAPPLLDRETIDVVADFITATPGARGYEIAKAAGLTYDHCRRVLLKLKADRGFTSQRGRGGYWPPPQAL